MILITFFILNRDDYLHKIKPCLKQWLANIVTDEILTSEY